MDDLDWLREILNVTRGLPQYLQQLEWKELLMIASVVVGSTLVAAVLFSVGRQRKVVGKMLPAKPQEKTVLSDAIVAGIEEEVFTGRLSRRRARFWYNWFGRELGLSDLMLRKEGKKLHPERARRLKGAINMRLLTDYTPVPLPGPTKEVKPTTLRIKSVK